MSTKTTIVGRRKSSIARVMFVKGKGNIKINNREPIEYFKRKSLVMEFKEPLSLVDFDNNYDINIDNGFSFEKSYLRVFNSYNLLK